MLDDTLTSIECQCVEHFRVTVDYDVGIVCDYDYLSSELVLPNLAHDQVIDQMVV